MISLEVNRTCLGGTSNGSLSAELSTINGSERFLTKLLKNILPLWEFQCDSYLIHQSSQALLASNAKSCMECQNVDTINGIIIMDSESEDAKNTDKGSNYKSRNMKAC